MILKRRSQLINFAPLLAASAAVLGTSQPIPIPRTHPIEEIHITVALTQDGTGSTLSAATSPVTLDGITGILKRITLSINDGQEPRNVVSYSGQGMLEYGGWTGLNLDPATRECIPFTRYGGATTIALSTQNRVTYRIPLVHPQMAEPLRTRCLLPVHTLGQDPLLTLDIAAATDFTSVAHFAAALVEVRLIQRLMPDAVTQNILKSGGFIASDLLETTYPLGAGVSGDNTFDLPLGGQYMNWLIRSYANLSSTTISRDVVDSITTFGNETKWLLRSGTVAMEEFRLRSLQAQNQFTSVQNSASQTSSPWFAGPLAANTKFQPASSVMLDFTGDSEETFGELGSLLDANIPANSGLKLQLLANTVAPASGQHTLFMGGQRLFGDLSRWQQLANV